MAAILSAVSKATLKEFPVIEQGKDVYCYTFIERLNAHYDPQYTNNVVKLALEKLKKSDSWNSAIAKARGINPNDYLLHKKAFDENSFKFLLEGSISAPLQLNEMRILEAEVQRQLKIITSKTHGLSQKCVPNVAAVFLAAIGAYVAWYASNQV